MTKKRWRKIMLWIFLLAPLVVLATLHLITAFMFMDDAALTESLPQAKIEYISFKDASIRVISVGTLDADSMLLFVHGAPGSWDAYKKFLSDSDFASTYLLVSYDRPAYGGSSGQKTADLRYHAEALTEILNAHRNKYVHVVGHSYGGPIAAMAALIEPKLIDKVTLIAPVIDPKNEPLWWVSYVSFWPLTRWMLPSDLRTAGIEKRDHATALLSLDTLWDNWILPLTHIHGYDDRLAPSEANIKYIEQNLPHDLLIKEYWQDEGHLVLWTDYDRVKRVLLK